NTQEVDMHQEVTDRVALVVLGEDLDLLAIQNDRRDRGHETAGMNALGDFIGRDRDGDRVLLATIDDSRDQTVAAKFTGGPLTNPFARLGLELVRCGAHGISFRGYLESWPMRWQRQTGGHLSTCSIRIASKGVYADWGPIVQEWPD